jgi:hypothetical protein
MPTIGNTLIAAQGSWEPQRVNNWLLSFANVANRQELYLSLKSFPFPAEGNAKKVVRWMNESRFYAGSVNDFGSCPLVIRDYIDKNAVRTMLEWRRMVWDPETLTVGIAANYKCSGTLSLLRPNDVDGDGTGPVRTVYLQGCWPTSFDAGSYDMDSDGEQALVTIEFSVDRAYAGGDDGVSNTAAMGAISLE